MICISKKFPDDIPVTALGTTLKTLIYIKKKNREGKEKKKFHCSGIITALEWLK
jgi:hypothetical protein